MRAIPFSRAALLVLGLLLPAQILAADTLSTSGYSLCGSDSDIKIHKLDITYARSTREITFDVAGTNPKERNVTASLEVKAYGKEVYSKEFNPCSPDHFIKQLCPVPAGNFSATGSQQVPKQFASKIPSIAFAVPDLDGLATLKLKSLDDGDQVACIKSGLTNGKSMKVPAVSYAAAGIAAAALLLSGLSSISAMGNPGTSSPSPGFGEVMGWFHSMATNGMLSVEYPGIYRSFSKNFAFSTGLISWDQMQLTIDNFRSLTGGNLTENNYKYLQNASLVYTDGPSPASAKFKRDFDLVAGAGDLVVRSLSLSANDTSHGNQTDGSEGGMKHVVSGIDAYVEQLMIPRANTFMTVLLIFCLVIAAITVGILLLKVILETWALYGTFPKSLTHFREHYWGIMGRTVTNMILILYGVWVLYCIYQFSAGDSWGAKVLAAVTLASFTALLLFFGIRIFIMARKYRKTEGDTSSLYENRETWRKYSLFYDNYKRDYWWIFVPLIVYMFAKGCILAGANGHGLVQSAGQLICEALLLTLLLWNRPYATKSTQWINITIQVVRVLSVVCVLVFVEELGIAQSTKTVTGVALIAVQSALTGILAILIAVNAIILCFGENPHVKRRKQAGKLKGEPDDLTPLDARESLLMEDHDPQRKEDSEMSRFNFAGPYQPFRDRARAGRDSRTASTDRLVGAEPSFGYPHPHAYPHAYAYGRSLSQESRGRGSLEERQPTAPGFAF
ncbi:DUF907 domain-containing protein [Aspergillus sp. HF37]|nr:DUF907 domain-containing protein [Aspergillus sp. HF37]